MADLRVNLFGKQLAGPVIAASGTFGFGPEYAGIEDLRVLGGISGKGLTLNGQPGNDGERLLETPSGLMNSIGLQNPGVQHFIENELPAMKTCGTAVWVNLGGHTIEENVEGVQKLCAAGIDVLELNISCPNVKQGGLAFGIRAKDAEEVVSAVRKVCTVPLVVKLSPQAESIPDMCKAVEAAGADGISLCNTFQACAIDLEKRRPVFNNIFAGLSGPAVRPIALRMVWQAVGAVNIPVVGLGGIATGRGMLAGFALGAEGIQMGTRFALSEESSASDAFKRLCIGLEEGGTMLALKKIGPTRLIRNDFYTAIETAENRGASAEELKELLGRGRSKRGIFEGDLADGELEIGQIASLIRDLPPAGEIVRQIIDEYNAGVQSLTTL